MGFQATAAGKTGTTSNYRDAWFAGFTPTLLALAWVGYDDNAEINMSGGRAALPLWTRFMKEVQPSGGGDFAGPGGVVLLKIDPRTGGLPSSACPGGVTEAFIEGTEPTLTCENIATSSEWKPAVPAAAAGEDSRPEPKSRFRPKKLHDDF